MLLDKDSKEKFRAYFYEKGFGDDGVDDIVEVFLENIVRIVHSSLLPLTYIGAGGSFTFKSFDPITVEIPDGNEALLPSFMALGVNDPSFWENVGNTCSDVKDIKAEFFPPSS